MKGRMIDRFGVVDGATSPFRRIVAQMCETLLGWNSLSALNDTRLYQEDDR